MTLAQRVALPDSYGLVLCLIVVSVLVTALAGENRVARDLVVVIQAGTLLYAQWTSRASPRVLRVSIGLVGAAVVFGLLSSAIPDLDGGHPVVAALLALATAAVIGNRFRHHLAIDGSTVLAAMCVYLLIGFFFAYVFASIDKFDDSQFFVQQADPGSVDFVYYSYVTLTTVGYGDLTTTEAMPRMVSTTEALMGQLYLVSVVALVVGNVGRRRFVGDSPTAESPEER